MAKHLKYIGHIAYYIAVTELIIWHDVHDAPYNVLLQFESETRTGCSSCWDGLGTFESRLASVTCYHWDFCASLSTVQNGFTVHTRVVACVAAGRAPDIWLYSKLCTLCLVPRWHATSPRRVN
eukprot:4499312-Pleurochrysis_carterae.AAC.1